YKDLQIATNNYWLKLGQGDFGFVYQGSLPNGTQLAVKKLEGISQGKKKFGAEVSIIGSIHHLHLVLLRGFYVEGSHQLLVYNYMMLEEGKLKDIMDTKLGKDEADARVHTSIMVALWCIQEDMSLRSSMTKVVQMLEGISYSLTSSLQLNRVSSLYKFFFKLISKKMTSS
ncbi:hypothetical protein C1H46_018477, partial [Malus baccata]